MTYRLTAAAVPLFLMLAGPAQAEAPQWRATVIGGLERTDSAPGAGAQDGAYYGLQLGADWDLGAVTVGAEAELGDSTAELTTPGNTASQGLFASGAVRLAVPLGNDARVFVRGGYAYHRIGNTVGPDFDGHGFTVGGGAEFDLGQQLFVRGEYRYSDYGQTVRGQHILAGVGLRF